MRDDFTQKTKLTLQHRVGNCCSNPGCRRKTTGPNSDLNKASNIGVACHITAASKNGPRYDADFSQEERKSILNGIWLCENCAKMIDVDCEIYPVESLYAWKHQSEAVAKYEYEGKDVPTELLFKGYYCPYCETFSKDGIKVCKGCHADICYGMTPSEKVESAKSWGVLGLMGGLAVFMILPMFLRSSFGWAVPDFLGSGMYAIGITAICSFSLMCFMPDRENRKILKSPPRFFKKISY